MQLFEVLISGFKVAKGKKIVHYNTPILVAAKNKSEAKAKVKHLERLPIAKIVKVNPIVSLKTLL